MRKLIEVEHTCQSQQTEQGEYTLVHGFTVRDDVTAVGREQEE